MLEMYEGRGHGWDGKMSRMFKSITDTWNVYKGCRFECSYCCARKLAETRLKNSPRYRDGFHPQLVEEELQRTFKPGEFIFVSFMGDIAFASLADIGQILGGIRRFPRTFFLLQTKDPSIFAKWEIQFPPHVYLGTTIETNRNYHLTKAPPPMNRLRQLAGYPHNAKFLSIEPITDFDLEKFTHWVELLNPDIIEVGADNYHNNLPEPSPEKLEHLLANLRNICPRVIEKDGLSRLTDRRRL